MSESKALAPRGSGTITRQEFGAEQSTALAETASSAVAAQARAAVEARYIMAMRRPRDWEDVRVRLLAECARPTFAAVARYRKPVGDGIEGPSIRFAEAAIRCMGNVLPEAAVIYDDGSKRIVRVTVTDLEANVPYSRDLVVEKSVERSRVRDGQTVISTRTNTAGKKTFIVQATEDDLANKEAALVSKAIRQLGLRLLPGDLLEECMDRVIETLARKDAADPDAARKKLADGFAAIGVMPAALKEYLGHELGACAPPQIKELRAIYTAIRDGEATWAEVIEERRALRDVEAAQKLSAPPPASRKAAPVRDARSQQIIDEEAARSEARAAAETPPERVEPPSAPSQSGAAADALIEELPTAGRTAMLGIAQRAVALDLIPDELAGVLDRVAGRIRELMAEAGTRSDLDQLREPIKALPPALCEALKAHYSSRYKALGA